MLSNQVGDGIYCYQRKKVSVYCAITRTNMVNCGRSFQYHIYGAVGLCPTICVYWQDKVLPENINITGFTYDMRSHHGESAIFNP